MTIPYALAPVTAASDLTIAYFIPFLALLPTWHTVACACQVVHARASNRLLRVSIVKVNRDADWGAWLLWKMTA